MTPCLTHQQLRHLAAPCCTRSSISSASFQANCVERKRSRPSWQEMKAQFLRMMLISMGAKLVGYLFFRFPNELLPPFFKMLHPVKGCKMEVQIISSINSSSCGSLQWWLVRIIRLEEPFAPLDAWRISHNFKSSYIYHNRCNYRVSFDHEQLFLPNNFHFVIWYNLP